LEAILGAPPERKRGIIWVSHEKKKGEGKRKVEHLGWEKRAKSSAVKKEKNRREKRVLMKKGKGSLVSKASVGEEGGGGRGRQAIPRDKRLGGERETNSSLRIKSRLAEIALRGARETKNRGSLERSGGKGRHHVGKVGTRGRTLSRRPDKEFVWDI